MQKDELSAAIDRALNESGRAEQRRKADNYRRLNPFLQPGVLLFTGSSLMEQFPIAELARSRGVTLPLVNRGIGGFTTDDFLQNIDAQLTGIPAGKVFINIGTNDMTDRFYGDGWMDHLFANYEEILRRGREALPNARFYVMAYDPTNHHLPALHEWALEMLRLRTKENIAACNRRARAMAEALGCRFINVNQGLTDEAGELKREYAIDGVHMVPEAYALVLDNLMPYITEP